MTPPTMSADELRARVEAGDASARSLPDEIEREVIALLLSARRAA